MAINFIYSKDFNETRTMSTKSNYETVEIIRELFESFLQKYKKDLEEKMKRSEFALDSVDLLCYKLHKISLNTSGLVVQNGATWHTFSQSHSKKNLPFLYTPF